MELVMILICLIVGIMSKETITMAICLCAAGLFAIAREIWQTRRQDK